MLPVLLGTPAIINALVCTNAAMQLGLKLSRAVGVQTERRIVAHAVQGEGDTVVARVLPNEPGKVVIEGIEGDGGRLTLDPAKNCIGVAATETLKLLGQVSCGVSLKLTKVGTGSRQRRRT
jgi:hypothetical protein